MMASLRRVASPAGSARRPAWPPARIGRNQAIQRGLVTRERTPAPVVQRTPGVDRVVYTGGQTGTLKVISGGSELYSVTAYTGHVPPAGHAPYGEHVKDEGPIPKGTYKIRPQKTNPTIKKFQKGTCSANAIRRGYQEIDVKEWRRCDRNWVYCQKDRCSDAAGKKFDCWNPSSCWGRKRIKIEGSAKVKKPGGGTVTRSGFYIHGGNPDWEASSGCIKVLDDRVFDHIRQMKGSVDVVVGDTAAYPVFIGPLQY